MKLKSFPVRHPSKGGTWRRTAPGKIGLVSGLLFGLVSGLLFGLVSGLLFGLVFGIDGLGSAALGRIADGTSITTVMVLISFLPLIGLLTVWLPTDARWRDERGYFLLSWTNSAVSSAVHLRKGSPFATQPHKHR